MKQHRWNTISALVVTLACLAPFAVPAAETQGEDLPLWELGIGGALYNEPNYPGSDVRSTTGFPFPYVIYRGDWNFKQQGWVFDTRLRYQRPLMGETLKLSAEVGASFADAKYIGYFYDVPPAYATPERPAFDSDSGYAGARLGLGFSGVYGKWRWSLFGAYMNFAGTAFENSPLLDSNHDFSLGATVGWMFWKSKSRVMPKNTSSGGEFETPLFGL